MYGYLRVVGKQNIVLWIQICSVITNLIFDIIVCVLGFGIIGVAIVTILIETSCMIACVILTKTFFNFKFLKTETKEILSLFKWNVGERAILKIDYFIFNMVVSRIGENEYAVHTLFIQLSDNIQAFISG